MAITAAQFAVSMTPDEYQAQMTQNKEQFAVNIAAAPVTEGDSAAFAGLPEPLHILVITEDWCGDSLAHLPVLFRLARESGKLDVRVFKRDEYKELASQYPMPSGRVAIPIIVFFDDAMHERGKFLERPDIAQAEMETFMAEFFTQHPSYGSAGTPISALSPDARQVLFAELTPWRKARLDAWNRAAIAQFTAIAAAAPVPA